MNITKNVFFKTSSKFLLLIVLLFISLITANEAHAQSNPTPEVRIVAPTFYVPYTPFDVTIYLKNINYSTQLTAYLDVSFPEDPTTQLIAQTADWTSVTKYAEGSQIYDKYENEITAEYTLFSAERSSASWSFNVEKYITIRVTPGSSGPIHINFRGTFITSSGTFRDPTSGSIDSQQGWYVEVHTVNLAPPDLVTTINALDEPWQWGEYKGFDLSVLNEGGAASGSFRVDLVASNDTVIGDSDDYIINSWNVSSLNPGNEWGLTYSLTLPTSPYSGMPSNGTVYYGLNAYPATGETDTPNNKDYDSVSMSMPTGTLNVTVYNVGGVDGTAWYGAEVYLFNSDWSSQAPGSPKFTDPEGKVSYTGLPLGDYHIQVNYTPDQNPAAEEIWGTKDISITSVSPLNVRFDRTWPTIDVNQSVPVVVPTTPVVIGGTASLQVKVFAPITDHVYITRVSIILDRSSSSPYDVSSFYCGSEYGVNVTHAGYTFSCTSPALTLEGTYHLYYLIETKIEGVWRVSDQNNWDPNFEVVKSKILTLSASPTSPISSIVNVNLPISVTVGADLHQNSAIQVTLYNGSTVKDVHCRTLLGGQSGNFIFNLDALENSAGTKNYTIEAHLQPGGSCPISSSLQYDSKMSLSYQVNWLQPLGNLGINVYNASATTIKPKRSGATVTLYDTNWNLKYSMLSNIDGVAFFENIPADTYHMEVFFTPDDQVPSATELWGSQNVTVVASTTTTVDFNRSWPIIDIREPFPVVVPEQLTTYMAATIQLKVYAPQGGSFSTRAYIIADRDKNFPYDIPEIQCAPSSAIVGSAYSTFTCVTPAISIPGIYYFYYRIEGYADDGWVATDQNNWGYPIVVISPTSPIPHIEMNLVNPAVPTMEWTTIETPTGVYSINVAYEPGSEDKFTSYMWSSKPYENDLKAIWVEQNGVWIDDLSVERSLVIAAQNKLFWELYIQDDNMQNYFDYYWGVSPDFKDCTNRIDNEGGLYFTCAPTFLDEIGREEYIYDGWIFGDLWSDGLDSPSRRQDIYERVLFELIIQEMNPDREMKINDEIVALIERTIETIEPVTEFDLTLLDLLWSSVDAIKTGVYGEKEVGLIATALTRIGAANHQFALFENTENLLKIQHSVETAGNYFELFGFILDGLKLEGEITLEIFHRLLINLMADLEAENRIVELDKFIYQSEDQILKTAWENAKYKYGMYHNNMWIGFFDAFDAGFWVDAGKFFTEATIRIVGAMSGVSIGGISYGLSWTLPIGILLDGIVAINDTQDRMRTAAVAITIDELIREHLITEKISAFGGVNELERLNYRWELTSMRSYIAAIAYQEFYQSINNSYLFTIARWVQGLFGVTNTAEMSQFVHGWYLHSMWYYKNYQSPNYIPQELVEFLYIKVKQPIVHQRQTSTLDLCQGCTQEVQFSVSNTGGNSNPFYIDVSLTEELDVFPSTIWSRDEIGSLLWQAGDVTGPSLISSYLHYGITDSLDANSDKSYNLVLEGALEGYNGFLTYRTAMVMEGYENLEQFTVRYPNLGINDQQNWPAIIVPVQVFTDPNPNISTNVVSLSLLDGEIFKFSIILINNGGPADSTYVDISLPDGLRIISISPNSNWSLYDIGENIYHADGSISPASERLYSLELASFPNNARAEYEVTVIADNIGSYLIKYRSSLNPKNINLQEVIGDTFIRNPNIADPGSVVDQQGWYAWSIPVTVSTNTPVMITSKNPDASIDEIEIGQCKSYLISASDPEGRSLTFKWYLNNRVVSEDASFNFCPEEGDFGQNQLIAVVSDGMYSDETSWDIDVKKIPTTIQIISDLPDPSVVYAPYLVEIKVTANAGTASGLVKINDGEGNNCEATLIDQLASCTLISSNAGIKTLSADYQGDGTYKSSSTSTSHQVNNPSPILSNVSPNEIATGSLGIILQIFGENFTNSSIVLWNGSNRSTTFVSPTKLTTAINREDLSASGVAHVSVFNPTPGGGISNELPVIITSEIPVIFNLYLPYLSNFANPFTNEPGVFNKIAPANGAVSQSINPVLSWESSSDATEYEYCVDNSNDGECSTWESNATGTSKTLSGLTAGTTYYWQVKATNSGGTTYANGSSTAFWSFTTLSIVEDWQTTLITNSDPFTWSDFDVVETGDADNDGFNEVYLSGGADFQSTNIWRYDYSDELWQGQNFVNPGGNSNAGIIIGDGNNDGFNEIYYDKHPQGNSPGGTLYQRKWDGATWTQSSVYVSAGDWIFPGGIDDIDEDNLNEVFTMVETTYRGLDIPMKFNFDSESWINQQLSSTGGDSDIEGYNVSAWVGDFDGDGNKEVIRPQTTTRSGELIEMQFDLITWDGASWNESIIYELSTDNLGFFMWSAGANSVGDVDHDGKDEVVISYWRDDNHNSLREELVDSICIFLIENSGGIWTRTDVLSYQKPSTSYYLTVDIGDANNDGLNEIYVGDDAGNVRMLSNQGATWSDEVIYSDPNVVWRAGSVNDVDHDGQNDLVLVGRSMDATNFQLVLISSSSSSIPTSSVKLDLPSYTQTYLYDKSFNMVFDTLFVGINATGDWPHCSGSISSVVVESLDGVYSLTEEFENAALFSQTGSTVFIQDGKAVFDNLYMNGGPQFVTRSIPIVTGPLKITVVGQIDWWQNNCSIAAGISDSHVTESNQAISAYPGIGYGWFGGGCSNQGPIIWPNGIAAPYPSDGCSFTSEGTAWVDSDVPIQAIYTIE